MYDFKHNSFDWGFLSLSVKDLKNESCIRFFNCKRIIIQSEFMTCNIAHSANIVYLKLKCSPFKRGSFVSHIILLKIKSLFHKVRASLTVHISPWSIKFRPSSEFIIANLDLWLPRMIILLRQVMIQGMDLTNPYRISSISSDSYIPIPIFALHHRHKTQTSELIGILHNLLSLVVLVKSGVPDLSGWFFFWRLFFVLRF